jgi:hypothetical protein
VSLPLAPEADVEAFDVLKPAFTLGAAMRSGTLRGRSLLGFRTSEKFMMAGKDGRGIRDRSEAKWGELAMSTGYRVRPEPALLPQTARSVGKHGH